MIHCIPSNFKEVEVQDFEEFLKTCADYYRDSYSGCSAYYFRHNGKEFAIVTGPPEKAFVDPELLTPSAARLKG